MRYRPKHSGRSLLIPATGQALPPLDEPGHEGGESLEGVPPDVVSEARENAAPASEWWVARRAGIPAEQARRLVRHGPYALLLAAIAVKTGAASSEEIADAVDEVPLGVYVALRDFGLSHAEAKTASGADLEDFEAAASKYSVAEVVQALSAGVPPADYAAFRRYASHEETLEARSLGVTSIDYVLAAGAGASHQEIIDVARDKGSLWELARRRNLGLLDSRRQTA